MLNFGKFLFNEAVTMNGKKIGDDNDTTGTTTGSTTTNTTNTGSTSTSGMGVTDDSDYTKIGRDDDTGATTDTTGGMSTGTAPTGDTGGGDSLPGAAGEDDTDYTKIGRDDDTSGGMGDSGDMSTGDTPTGDTGGGGNTPGAAGEDDTDYTKIGRDDDTGAGDTGDSTGTDQNATGDAPTGDAGGGGNTPGAAGEDDVDYTKIGKDDDTGAGGGDGTGADSTGTDQNATGDAGVDPNATDDGSMGADPQQALKDIEAKLFSELSPEQLQIKDNELKIQYINLYEDIEKTEQRVNRIVKTENNEDVVAFISKKLDDLKDLVHRILTETYQTQTWLQNMLTYQHCLSIFAGIGELLRNLSKKDSINKNFEKDNNTEDLDNEVITSTNSEG